MGSAGYLSGLRNSARYAVALGVSGAVIIGTGLLGLGVYDRLKSNGSFERYAAAYYIASGKSQERIAQEAQAIKGIVSELDILRQDISAGILEEDKGLEKRIAGLEADGDAEAAAKLYALMDEKKQVDAKIGLMYAQAQDKLSEMAEIPKMLETYNTYWARAAKLEAIIRYDIHGLSEAAYKELEESGGLIAKSTGKVKEFGDWWSRNVKGTDPEASEKRFLGFKQEISMYLKAEMGKQGIANVLHYVNDVIKAPELAFGERQMYALAKDVIMDTGDVSLAKDIVEYVRTRKLPEGLDLPAKKFLESQSDLLGTIDNCHALVQERMGIVVEAEEIGQSLRKAAPARLDKIISQAESISERLESSDLVLKADGIEAQDPDYRRLVSLVPVMYFGGLGLVMALEAAAAFYGTGNIRLRQRNARLSRENARLREEIG